MSVDKAFEENNHDKIIGASFFAFRHFGVKSNAYRRGFFNGYTAGQKSLSPEVREVIEQLLDMIKRCEAGYSVRYTTDMIIRDKAKLLAKE